VPRRAILVAAAGAALVLVAPAEAAYRPAFSLTLSDGRPAAAPAVTATVTQAPGESASRRLAVRYPPQFGFNPGFAVTGCAASQETAGACPEESRIGTSRAVTLLGTFSGPVYLSEDFRLLAYLRGPAGMPEQKLEGKLYLHPDGSIEIVFDDLPNLPATLAETTVEGGSRGLLLTPRHCGSYRVAGSFRSHAGEESRSDVPIEITGCPERPVISGLRTRPRRFKGHTTLRWRLSQPARHTSVSVQRLAGSRWRELRVLVGPGRVGDNRLRVGGRRLRSGRYRFVLRAMGRDGLASRSRSVGAIVVPTRGRSRH
jgi:hypothetical protein